MKRTLLLCLAFIFLIFLKVQSQGGPPPCGITAIYECDDNGDGIEEFNLVEGFTFLSLDCGARGESENDYGPIVYYETEEDMINETNPIPNPTAYTNKSISQEIYYRANAINANAKFSFLTAVENSIEVQGLKQFIANLEVYDDDYDGITTFDLTTSNIFCGSQDINDYNVSYYSTQSEADSGSNFIVNPDSFQNSTNPQRIFVRAENINSGIVYISSFQLKVLVAVANEVNIVACGAVNLSTFNLSVLGSQDPSNFVVSYYLTLTDAENEINILSNAYNTIGNSTLYVRVEEETKGTYAIAPFNIEIISPPEINEPTPIELCDDVSNDGLEVFDLTIKTPEIIGTLTGVTVTYHESQSDAENNLNSILPYSYINVISTVYVRVQNDITGCYSIATLDLIVQDCTSKGVIEINAFYDENEDETFDNDEINFLNGVLTYEKNNDGVLRNLYSSNGIFKIISDDENNTYDISYSIIDEYSGCYNVTTTSFEDINVSNGSTANYNFPVTKTVSCGDIAVYLVSFIPPRPGFDYRNYLVVQNRGIETVTSGSIDFNMDTNLTLKSVSRVDTGNSVVNTSSGFRLDFVNLAPNERETVYIDMNVPIPTPLGTLLTNTATYSEIDSSIDNNTSILSEVVIGSYDPNDIQESHGPEILHSSFASDDYLFYTIRFQNVGTADAINVSIDNTLDSRLDNSTIEMLSSSHSNVFTRIDNQLNWQFDNIHLPSEDMDEPNSHGYVYYKIKPTAGYSAGDIIPNTAEIYFDFNPAVITNTWETEFTTTLSSEDFDRLSFRVSPNPAKDVIDLEISQKNNLSHISIFDLQGKTVYTQDFENSGSNVRIDVSELSGGLYFIKLNGSTSEFTQKLIIE